MTSATIKLAVGVDVGGTNTVFALVDRAGRIHGQNSIPTADYPDPDNFVEELYIGIRRLAKDLGFDHRLAGIGIGAPNVNYFKGTIEGAANLAWKGEVALADKLRRLMPDNAMPVILTNDAKTAAVGEMTYGGAQEMKDFLMITLGTGMGSGFVAGGQIVYGHDSFAGELGHVTVNPEGRMCGCGRKGCLETYASASGIKRTVFKLLADHTEKSEFRDVTFNQLTSKMITAAALAGDPLAIEAFEYTGKLLGQALANAVAVTSPEAIFLSGGLAQAGKYLFEPTKKYMELSLLANYRNKVKLLPSQLGETNVSVLGASALVWQKIEEPA